MAQRLSACGAEDLARGRAKLVEAQRLGDTLHSSQALPAQLVSDGLETFRRAHTRTVTEAGMVSEDTGDPAPLGADLTVATTTEGQACIADIESQVALHVASKAQSAAAATLATARCVHDASAAEASDSAILTTKLRSLHDARTGH